MSTVTVAQEVSSLIEDVGDMRVGAQLSHGSAGTESFEIQDADGQVYRVCVVPIPLQRSSEFKPEPDATQTGPGFKLSVGMRVRSGAAAGGTFGLIGKITTGGKRADRYPGRVWILWEGDLLPNGYGWDSEIVQCLQKEPEPSRFSALRNVHFIRTMDAEPECGDRTGSVSSNPDNVGCLRCRGTL